MGANVDPIELRKFNESSANWWDEAGPMRILHQINPVRLNYLQQFTSLNEKSILDVGCGGGIFTESLAKAGGRVAGIDANVEAIEVAKNHARQEELMIDYQCELIEDYLETDPESFEIITCLELLEHVPDPNAIIEHCDRLLKPGGLLLLSTINRTPKAYLFAILAAEYFLDLLPKETHDYQKFMKPSELNAYCSAFDLSLLDITGLHYSPLSKKASLTSDVSINYLICYQKK